MSWRAARWLLRIVTIAVVLYAAWYLIGHFLGKHYFRQGMVAMADHPSEAMRAFSIAVKLQPQEPRYHAALGRAALKSGRFSEAAAALERAARRRPQDLGIWHDLGVARLKCNSPAQAAEAFRRALEIRPTAEPALEGLAEATMQIGEFAAASEALERLWRRSPTNVGLGARLASVLVKQGKPDAALQVCAKVRQSAPQPERSDLVDDATLTEAGEKWRALLVAEGDAYRAKARWADAILAYQRSLLLDPRHEPAIAGLEQIPLEQARRFPVDFSVQALSFSPSGRQVAFCGAELRVVDLFTGEVTRIATLQTPRHPTRPAWSPDGRRLCYASGTTLHMVNRDGTGDRVLMAKPPALPHLTKLGIRATFDSSDVQGQPAWSPSGKAVALPVSLQEGVSLTFVVDVQSGRAQCTHHTTGRVPKFASSGFGPAWSPDGRILCAPLMYRPSSQSPGLTVWSAQGVVKRQIALPREGIPLADARSAVQEVQWSPDARYVGALLRLANGARTVLALVPVAQGKTGRIIAKDVIAFRWRDPSHVWLLQKAAASPINMHLRELTSDLRGNLTVVSPVFPLIPSSVFDLSRDRQRLAMVGPSTAGTGAGAIWVFELGKLRRQRQ